MDVVEPLVSIENFLGCLVLCWRTNNNFYYTNIQVLLKTKEPSAPLYDIVNFQNITSVLQVVRKKYEIDDDLCRVHWDKHKICLKLFEKLGSAVEEESQDTLELN